MIDHWICGCSPLFSPTILHVGDGSPEATWNLRWLISDYGLCDYSDYQGSVSQGIPMVTKLLAATKNYFGCRCML